MQGKRTHPDFINSPQYRYRLNDNARKAWKKEGDFILSYKGYLLKTHGWLYSRVAIPVLDQVVYDKQTGEGFLDREKYIQTEDRVVESLSMPTKKTGDANE